MLLVFILLSTSSALARSDPDSITITPVYPTSADNIVAIISGCRGYSMAIPESVIVEFVGNVIKVIADLPGGGFAVGSCYEQEVVIGLVPPGNYTVSYYVDDRVPELQATVAMRVTGEMGIPVMSSYGLILLALLIAWIAQSNGKSEKT